MVYWAWSFRLAGYENVYNIGESNEIYYTWSNFGPGYYVCLGTFIGSSLAVFEHPDKETDISNDKHQSKNKVLLLNHHLFNR